MSRVTSRGVFGADWCSGAIMTAGALAAGIYFFALSVLALKGRVLEVAMSILVWFAELLLLALIGTVFARLLWWLIEPVLSLLANLLYG
jgi:hypothetical protein